MTERLKHIKMMREVVSAWMEKVVIPTYGTGAPEKNPIFLQKRVYQGSSGAVYPHAVIEKILDEKKDKTYNAIFLENEYLRIMILPELGGRIQRAYDKIRNRDFIYYNHVIKPALVGLTGPWISGGIEFNWPQHHRPSTFEPVDADIEENEDGSKTVWVNEVELMSRTKGMAGFTLYPGRAYLEVKARLHNRTNFPQTFLWWANPAVKVNDEYQSVFPPDVHAVYDHGKRDVSDFPVATGTYYKVNYAPGTDISRYRNIPVPTSFMAASSKYDFIGCYEHDTKAGMLHVANHHVVPGKKQWTWGNGDFGIAWDRNLTDDDGPYIELMCGAFTDNQPDFSWLQPNEQKCFEQYFLPYAQIGAVKNANRDVAVNLEIHGEKAVVGVYATSSFDAAAIVLTQNGREIFRTLVHLSPTHIFSQEISIPATENSPLQLDVLDSSGRLLISFKPENSNATIPPPATAAKLPSEISSVEQLFLNGLHLEQYRHATFSPLDYYKEALRREPTDIRCNNALGLWLLRRAKFEEAEPHFRTAISTLTSRNPNPYDGEAYYNLGVCLIMQGRSAEAHEAFYKSAWNDAMQHVAFLQLARNACAEKRYEEALMLADRSLSRNSNGHTARHIKAIVLRKMGRTEEALQIINEGLKLDRFHYGCRFEQTLIHENRKKEKARTRLLNLSRAWFGNFIEYAIDYLHAGCYHEAIAMLELYIDETHERVNPLAFYYLAFLHCRLNQQVQCSELLETAASTKPDFCFPSRIEDVMVLQWATNVVRSDYRAFYYLGNYWYANDQWEDAIRCWEKSAELNDSFPTVQRNLALAYHNKKREVKRSLKCMQRAFELDTSDARVLMELDQLNKLYNYAHQERLDLLEKHLSLVEQRDDLYLERITLYNQLGEHEKAQMLLAGRKFHPWEGGEGKTVAQHHIAHLELAKQAFRNDAFDKCLNLLDRAAEYPHNLGEGKLPGAQENDLHYFRGCCFERLNEPSKARQFFLLATEGISEPVQAIFYNDPQPDKIVYQGLAWLKLGEEERAKKIFERLSSFGQQHMEDDIRIDYFAVSLPDLLVFDQDLNKKNRVHCIYLQALGNLGLLRFEIAAVLFNEVLSLDLNHQGAQLHKNLIAFLKQQMYTA